MPPARLLHPVLISATAFALSFAPSHSLPVRHFIASQSGASQSSVLPTETRLGFRRSMDLRDTCTFGNRQSNLLSHGMCSVAPSAQTNACWSGGWWHHPTCTSAAACRWCDTRPAGAHPLHPKMAVRYHRGPCELAVLVLLLGVVHDGPINICPTMLVSIPGRA